MADPVFTLMGCGFRRDRYAKAGDSLPSHKHDFDHGIYVERGSVRVKWHGDPTHEVVMREGEGGAAIFRRGRSHSVIALEDGTIVMTILPEEVTS